jgi:hypothetical protein
LIAARDVFRSRASALSTASDSLLVCLEALFATVHAPPYAMSGKLAASIEASAALGIFQAIFSKEECARLDTTPVGT